jgi:hypothetical protein
MTGKEQAKIELELHQRYLRIAHQVGDAKIRLAYEGLAQQALRHAARLDPSTVNRNTSPGGKQR